MQLLFRAGAPSATLTLSCGGDEDVWVVKQRLAAAHAHLGPPSGLVLTHGGRVLQDGALLADYFLRAGSTVHVTGRLRGGGGDGGSTGAESRSCYLEMYQNRKPDKVNPAEGILARWTRCHLSGQDLQLPCVIDELGSVYNKEALVSALLGKTLPASLSYITGLKSVVEVKLTPKPDADQALSTPKAAVKGLHQPDNAARFHCPVTGLEFNGRFRFVVHRPSGLAVAEKALKEVPAVVYEAVGASAPPGPEDWLPVNPTGEQLEALKQKQAAKMAVERAKKAKKAAAKLAAANGAASDGAGGGVVAALPIQGKESPEAASDVRPGQKRAALALSGAATASMGAGSVANGAPPVKKAKAVDAVPQQAASAVFASLFTSSLKNAPKETYLCRNTSARGQHLT